MRRRTTEEAQTEPTQILLVRPWDDTRQEQEKREGQTRRALLMVSWWEVILCADSRTRVEG